MDVSKMNVMCWFKVLLACFALAVSGCGSTDSGDTVGVEEDAKEDSSDETEDIGQDDGEEEPLEASGEEKSEEMEEKELGFLEKIAQEEGVCFAGVDVKSVDVYAPFLQFEEGAVIESDAIKVDVTPVSSVLKLSDNFVVSDFTKAEEGDSWVSEQVSEGSKADSVEYVEYTFQGKIKGSFKYHDKIFFHETLNNAEAQHHLMFYEVLKTYFDKYGYFKLSFNGNTYVATQAGHLYTFEFTNFKQILGETAKDEMVEESEASEGMEGEESEESEESSEKSEKSAVYFEADVVAKYSYNELAENAVQVKSAEACAAAEAEKEEAAEGEEGEASHEDSMMESEAGDEGQEKEAAAEETAGEAAAAATTTDEASESAEKEKEGAEAEVKEESSEAEASTASEGSSSEGEGEAEAAEASEGSAGEEKAAE